MEADLAVVVGAGWRREFPDGRNEGRQLPVVGADARVEFGSFRGERVMIHEHPPQAHEGADDVDAHRHRLGRVEHLGGHQCAVFCERKRKVSLASVTLT